MVTPKPLGEVDGWISFNPPASYGAGVESMGHICASTQDERSVAGRLAMQHMRAFLWNSKDIGIRGMRILSH